MRDWSAPALPVGWATSGQPPFVARRDEVAALESAWADVVAGAGRAVFVSGEPGWGKSRLVAEVGARLRERGAGVLVGSCIEELGAPFEPFDVPLGALLPAYRDQAMDAAARASAALLERVLAGSATDAAGPAANAEPAVARGDSGRVGAADADGAADLAGAVAPAGQEPVFAAAVDVLRAASAARPVVLVLEDLHWAGPAAVRLLARIVEGTVDARVLVVGTFRASPGERSAALTETLASLARLHGVQRVELAPFTSDEIAGYVATLTGVDTARARESAAILQELTAGNPFLLRAMWRPVVEAERHGDQRVIELPDSVGELVRARVAALDPGHRGVLELAAVLGQEVDLGEIIGVSAASVDTTLAAMDAAARARLIEPPRQAGDAYRFPHAIARQAVLDLIPGTELLRAHARIAQVLEDDFPTAPRRIQRLAHHYAAARALGFGDRAVTYLSRAAQLAEARFAYEDAGRLYERAAEISPDPAECSELMLSAAANWNVAADTARARRLYERMTESGDPRARLRAAIGYEDASWRPGLTGHRALEMLREAMGAVAPAAMGAAGRAGRAGVPGGVGVPGAAAPPPPHFPGDHDPLVIEGLSSLARATAYTGAVDEAEALASRAVGLARDLGDPDVLAAALRMSVTLTLRPRGVATRLEQAAELTALTRARRDDWFGITVLHRAANGYLVGDRAVMDESERDLVEVRRQWGRHWKYWLESVRFGRALVTGRFDDAERARRRMEADESVFRSDATSSATAVQGYMIRRETGGIERLRPLVRDDESPADRWAPGLLALYTELELQEPARRVLDWLLAHAESESHDSGDWPARLAFMSEAAVLLGDADAAARLHPWLEEYAGLDLMSGMFVALFGPADAYLGELESLRGDGDPDARFASALDLAERSGADLHVARTLAATAAHLRRSDPGSQPATELAERARAIAEPAGMVRVLRALGAGPAASASEPGGLTAREREVIALIAEGRSNRDIAAELVISEHTAANHVRNILTKIGAENRTQAARFAHERGLA